MSPLSTTIAWSCIGLEVLLLVGLFVHQRVRQSYMLVVLVVSWLGSALIVAFCPACLTWRFWLVTELAHAALAFSVALELAWRAFRQVPRAWWWAQRAVVAAVVLGAVLLIAAPPGPPSVSIVPWVLGALACLYIALWLTAIVVGLPQERLHAAILTGLSPYLIVYAVTWGQVASDTGAVNVINPVMFLLALLALTRAAWRRETIEPGGHPETVRWLFPWRS